MNGEQSAALGAVSSCNSGVNAAPGHRRGKGSQTHMQDVSYRV